MLWRRQSRAELVERFAATRKSVLSCGVTGIGTIACVAIEGHSRQPPSATVAHFGINREVKSGLFRVIARNCLFRQRRRQLRFLLAGPPVSGIEVCSPP